MRRVAVAFGLFLSLSIAPGAHAALGDLTQPAGLFGCTQDVIKGNPSPLGCAVGRALDQPMDLAVSPDGRNAYVPSVQTNAIAIFDYDEPSGAMIQKGDPHGCINRTPDGSGGNCRVGTNEWYSPQGVAVSVDGENVYSTSTVGILTFDRDTDDGDLTQKALPAGCHGSGPGCSPAGGISGWLRVAVSPDDAHLYAATTSGVVAWFSRGAGGVLTYAGCINEGGTGGCADGKGLTDITAMAITPDGKGVYVTTNGSGNAKGIGILDRNTSTGALSANVQGCISENGASAGGAGECVDSDHLTVPRAITVGGPNGEHVYVVGDQITILTFDRDTGANLNRLTRKAGADGCMSYPEGDATCADGRVFSFPSDLAVSPDGANLYVATTDDRGVAVFDRDTASGVIAQKEWDAGCHSALDFWYEPSNPYGVDCRQSRATRFPLAVAVNPDGKAVYLVSDVDETLANFVRETGSDPDPGPGDDGGDGSGGGGDGGAGDPAPPAPLPVPPNLVAPRPPPPPQPSRVRTVVVSSRPGNGTVDVQVTTDGAGRIEVSASAPVNVGRPRAAAVRRVRIARSRRTVTAAGSYKLTLRPTKRAKKVLRRKGTLKARLTIKFTPANGTPASTRRQSAVFRLRRR